MVSTEEKNPIKGKIATITDWHSIDWKRAERQVGILQKKVSNAYKGCQMEIIKSFWHKWLSGMNRKVHKRTHR